MANFWNDESGQDLVEYTLLMMGIGVSCAGLIMMVGTSAAGLWATVNSRLAAANTSGT